MSTSLTRGAMTRNMKLQLLMESQQKIEIGQRIRDLRERSPHTTRSIAEHVGISERSVAAWIEGKTAPSWDHAKSVAELFDKDVDYILRGRDGAEPTPDVLGELSGGLTPDDVRRMEARQIRMEAMLKILLNAAELDTPTAEELLQAVDVEADALIEALAQAHPPTD